MLAADKKTLRCLKGIMLDNANSSDKTRPKHVIHAVLETSDGLISLARFRELLLKPTAPAGSSPSIASSLLPEGWESLAITACKEKKFAPIRELGRSALL